MVSPEVHPEDAKRWQPHHLPLTETLHLGVEHRQVVFVMDTGWYAEQAKRHRTGYAMLYIPPESGVPEPFGSALVETIQRFYEDVAAVIKRHGVTMMVSADGTTYIKAKDES